jgi:hypothetical protein
MPKKWSGVRACEVLRDGHAAAIVAASVGKPTDGRAAKALCYLKWLTLISPGSERPVVGPGVRISRLVPAAISAQKGVKHGHEWLTGVFHCPIPALGKRGEMLMNCRGAGIPAKGTTLVGMDRRPETGIDFEAVRTAIGAALRTHYSEVLREPIPDRMAELLRELDHPYASDQDTGEA